MAKTRDLAKVLRKKLASNPALRAEVEKERFNSEIARQILVAREQAGLTQEQLARLSGTHQSAIARLEDADYGGHSLSMLWKIAGALNKRLSLTFRPAKSPTPRPVSPRKR